jgi:putative transport protein
VIQLLLENPLLLLFIVAAIGYPLGQIKIKGSSLGVAAVLFVGLAIGSLHPDLKLPEVVYLLGLVIFVYTIGLSSVNGLSILLADAAITLTAALATLWVGHNLLKIPMSLLIGMLAGLQTQPAVLGFALEQTGNELPNIGYATVYPVAMISKILLAQLLLALLL